MRFSTLRLSLFFFKIIVLLFFFKANGQDRPLILPQFFNQFSTTLYNFNPGYITKSDTSFTLRAGYLGFTGIRKNNNNAYINITASLGKESLNHRLGLHIQNKAEGSFFRTSRVYLSYGLAIPLSRNSQLSAGAMIGLLNYRIVGNDFTSGATAFSSDASVGIGYDSKRLRLSAAIVQMLNSKITPRAYEYVLIRNYSLSTEFIIYDNGQQQLIPLAMLRYVPEYYTEYVFGFNFHFIKYVGVQSLYTTRKGVDLTLLLREIDLMNGTVQIALSYNIYAIQSSIPESNHYEFTMHYRF